MIPTINKFQLDAITRAANTRTKIVAAATGIKADRQPAVLTAIYDDFQKLVELGLIANVTSKPAHRKFASEMRAEGRKVLVACLTYKGQLMFEKRAHDKWVN